MKTFTKILCTTALVAVGSQVSAQALYDNFEDVRLLDYPSAEGQGGFTQNVPNPGSNTVNSSSTCGKYVRDSTQSYSTFVTRPKSGRMADVSEYVAGTKKFTIKFRGPAAGVVVQAVLQNREKANLGYPKGKFAGDFYATTTAANTWETLTFTLTPATKPGENVDATVLPTDVDQMVFLVNPDTKTGDTYYFDDIMGPELIGVVTATTAKSHFNTSEFAPAYPNPTSGVTQLPFSLQKPAVVSLAVYDNMGRRVAQVLNNEAKGAGQFVADLDASKLASGLYTCRLTVDGVAQSRRLSVQ